MVLYLRSKSDGSIKELKLKPGLYKAGKKYNHDKELTYSGMVPTNVKLAKGSILVAASLRNSIYYTDPEGEDIYGYSIVSEGNYQSSPLLKTPAGQKVVDMKVDKESKYLYVALTDGSKSTIQRIDLESHKMGYGVERSSSQDREDSTQRGQPNQSITYKHTQSKE